MSKKERGATETLTIASKLTHSLSDSLTHQQTQTHTHQQQQLYSTVAAQTIPSTITAGKFPTWFHSVGFSNCLPA